MKVKWASSAIADLAGIYAHIAQDSSQYAQRVVDRITNRTKQIGAFPYSGQEVPEYTRNDIGEVIEYSYRLIYVIEADVIHVVAVIHAAQILPDKSVALRG
ncbi:MAG TPA: type II toxin-antitoxin system RelE/ParE family toxin [Planctomycetaceae bacterium]|nr:type II toxin-antitoxin system RelE/ParE family toxin [Planctomycetaceae bacterium]